MSLRETYRLFFSVVLLLIIFTGSSALAQESLLDREITLNHNNGEIIILLKEIARKGKFSFTYTSQIQTGRFASVLNRKQSVRNHLADIFRYDSIQILEQNKKVLLIPLVKKTIPTVNYRSIKGLIIDKRTRRPLSYSNVFLNNKSTGTTSNSTGRFELKINSADFDDSLGISHIGFENITIPIASIDSGLLVIRLSPERTPIKEVVVKPLDPVYILTKAIEKISSNYECKPVIYAGFFRESTQQDNKSVSLSEAIVNVYKESYSSGRDDQIKIFKGRKGSNTDQKEFVDFIVQGGLYNTLQLDIVKNVPTFLDADYFTLYQYRLERTIMHFNRLTYIISFDQRPDVKYPCYRGKLYIDFETFAIVGADFEMPETGMSYAAGMYIKKTPRHTGVKPITAKYNVYYRYYNSKWNLSNIRSQVLIRVKRKKDKQQDKFNSFFASVSEFVITNKDTTNVVRFKAEEISRPRDILEEQIGETDYEFWGEENIIIPEEPIEKSIIRIGRRNNILSEAEIEAIRIEKENEDLHQSKDPIKKEEDMNNDSIEE
jgi:hypothetical protein